MRTMRGRTTAVWSVGVALAVLALPNRGAEACIAIDHAGVLPVAGEEALIVWDEASHTEHFIRRAAFTGIDTDFGFVVPTPSEPELSEVDDAVFDRLFRLYRRPPPPVRRDPRVRGRGRVVDDALASGVEVVREVQVAGLTSTILRATSATALDGWLTEHGYATSPELVPYLTPYVAAGWYLTAFRVDPGAGSARDVSMRSVRMSFATDRPFFPYSEPQTAGRTARPFRVSVVSGSRMSALEGTAAWGASVGFAQRSSRLGTILRGVVPASARGGRLWITTFDEPRSRRGTSDLFFVPSEDTGPVASTIDARIVGFPAGD